MSRAITIEDLYGIKFVSRPRISPDGQQVACVVTTIDEHKHEYCSTIWMVPSAGGDPIRFTGPSSNAHSPAWSPDGRWLAFISDRESDLSDVSLKDQKRLGKGKPQVWLISTIGGEARQVTYTQFGAGQPLWSPDGSKILFSTQTGPEDEETEDGKVLPKARVVDNLWYRLDGVGFINERRQHLFLIEAHGSERQEPVQLTDGDWDDGEAAWAPDGSRIVFTSSREEDRWHLPVPDVYTLRIEGNRPGELSRLTDGSIACASPSWSPDSNRIAFLGSLKFASAGHINVYSLDAQATGEKKALCLTEKGEASYADWLNSDLGDEHLAPAPVWSADGRNIYALGGHRGASRIFVIPRDGTNAEAKTLTPGNIHVRDFSADRESKQLAMLVGSATTAPEIFLTSPASPGEQHRITNFNDELLGDLELSTPELLQYTGADEWPIDGWVMKPANFDPSKKYPLIVEIHGGPHTQYGYGFFHEMQVLTASGYVVLYTNPRGSSGYGYKFALAVRGDWGPKDSQDIQAGIDALIGQGYIDEKRIGVTGGSYGGFMTNWLIGHSDRFKVAVTDRCVSNLASFFGSSDFGFGFADDDFLATPWDEPEVYARHSPITYVKNMHTPLLIIHSEQDLRCNIEQAEQLFAALKYLGREARLIRFEGQSHGLSRGGHPKLRLERLKAIKGWFDDRL